MDPRIVFSRARAVGMALLFVFGVIVALYNAWAWHQPDDPDAVAAEEKRRADDEARRRPTEAEVVRLVRAAAAERRAEASDALVIEARDLYLRLGASPDREARIRAAVLESKREDPKLDALLRRVFRG